MQKSQGGTGTKALVTTLSCFDMVVSEICLGQDRNTQPEHDLKLLLHHLHLELPPQPPPRITAPAPSLNQRRVVETFDQP